MKEIKEKHHDVAALKINSIGDDDDDDDGDGDDDDDDDDDDGGLIPVAPSREHKSSLLKTY